MATIRLKLLETKRIAILNESNEEIFQGGNDELVIAGESNVTRITLDYDESMYGSYTFYADMINARGEGKQYLIGQSKNILLSDDMTYPGYTKIFISARKDEEIARWEKLNLRIWSTIPKYGNDPTKPNQPTVDIIPNIRFNASVDNNSGVPTVDVIKSGTLENPIFTLNFKNLRGSNLKPNGTATSTQILAFQEDKGIWVGTDTGYWYYWNGTQYSEGGAFQSVEIEDGAITTSKLADGSVTTQKLRDKAVTTSKLGMDVTVKLNYLEASTKNNLKFIQSHRNDITYNSDRLDILEAQINADKNTIEYTSDKEIELTCGGANIVDCNAHFKKIQGRTRRKSLNLWECTTRNGTQNGITYSFKDSKLILNGTCTSTFQLGLNGTSNVFIVPTRAVYSVLVNTNSVEDYKKITWNYWFLGSIEPNTIVTSTQEAGNELRVEFSIPTNATFNNFEVEFMLVEGSYTNDTMPPFEPYDNTLVNSKATFVSTGRNLLNLSNSKNDNASKISIVNDVITISANSNVNIYWDNFVLPKGKYLFQKYFKGSKPSNFYGRVFTQGTENFFDGDTLQLDIKQTSTISFYFSNQNSSTDGTFRLAIYRTDLTTKAYEPYIKNISQYDIELGAYDYIENGNLIKQTSEMITLNGSEGWTKADVSKNIFIMNNFGAPNNHRKAIINSANWSYKPYETWLGNSQGFDVQMYDNEQIRIDFNCDHMGIKTLDQWKAYLKANPITLVYQKATPTITPIVVPNGIVSYKNGLTSQEIKGKYLPYKYTAKYVNGGQQ